MGNSAGERGCPFILWRGPFICSTLTGSALAKTCSEDGEVCTAVSLVLPNQILWETRVDPSLQIDVAHPSHDLFQELLGPMQHWEASRNVEDTVERHPRCGLSCPSRGAHASKGCRKKLLLHIQLKSLLPFSNLTEGMQLRETCQFSTKVELLLLQVGAVSPLPELAGTRLSHAKRTSKLAKDLSEIPKYVSASAPEPPQRFSWPRNV